MAVTKKYTQSIPVQLTEDWRKRVTAVCDAAEVSKAEIIRTCIETTLPAMEVGLGIASEETKAALLAQIAEDAGLEWQEDDEEPRHADVLDIDSLVDEPEEPVKTAAQLRAEAVEQAKLAGDRSAGLFGWQPPAATSH